MKLLIIEATDNCGKDLLVSNVTKGLRNYIVRHFSSPPGINTNAKFENQKLIFEEEFRLQDALRKQPSKKWDLFIWNRSHIGEAVYAPIYRGTDTSFIWGLEQRYAFDIDPEVYLVYLYADAEFVCSHDDGLSFTIDVDKKKAEQQAFETAVDLSIISKKLKIKINEGNNYVDQHRICASVRSFIGV